MASTDATPYPDRDVPTESDVLALLGDMDPATRQRYHGPSLQRSDRGATEAILHAAYLFGRPQERGGGSARRPEGEGERKRHAFGGDENIIVEMKIRVEQVIESLEDRLPVDIWTCCRSCCFANLAIAHERDDFLSFSEVLRIHKVAKALYERIDEAGTMLPDRRKSIGYSNPAVPVIARSRQRRNEPTARQRAVLLLKTFIEEVLPFLRGMAPSTNGRPALKRRLCIRSVCLILGVSTHFLYRRLCSSPRSSESDMELLDALIDSAGVRQRQVRRLGKRSGFPNICDLPHYDCGCSSSCLEGASVLRLQEWWDGFRNCSKHIKPREKENRYLIQFMHCPLLNSTIHVCDNALSALFTVSPQKIGNVRYILNTLYDDSSLSTAEVLSTAEQAYSYSGNHPMNRYSNEVRQKIEMHLDMILRPDPGASDGKNVCRVYSPEINTQEKLRAILSKQLKCDSILQEPMPSTSLQRLITEYLREKNCVIKFTQSDHNACPICKTQQYALLQFSHEAKVLKSEVESLERKFSLQQSQSEDPLHARLSDLKAELKTKVYQEKTVLEGLKDHNDRDASIRGFIKRLTDCFRAVERSYRSISNAPKDWCSRRNHGMITHQDDMTKVDLPSFVVNASSDITRWRYDVNAHVNAVDGECIVFSHEQGAGPKNQSSISELVLLDHILRCRGESIKVVVSDNAAVGKNWVTTIALPQYIVDQGLAEIVLIVFLENNHGKWLADMLFGQLQIRRRRATLTGVDALLSEFESINRADGSVQGFVVNPLACVDLVTVLQSLGYLTAPPPDFAFTKRNIHFAAACTEDAKRNLTGNVKNLLADLLPDEEGMVRVCSYPPSGENADDIPFERRCFDVPAAAACHNGSGVNTGVNAPQMLPEAPLVVDRAQQYKPSGNCVVSARNMEHVGFNGIVFRKGNAYPELKLKENRLVQESWPSPMLTVGAGASEELICGAVAMRCAPENWVLRRPVSRFRSADGSFVARYPPKNMLNAQYGQGPRAEGVPGCNNWTPVTTYHEPPVPVDTGFLVREPSGPVRRAQGRSHYRHRAQMQTESQLHTGILPQPVEGNQNAIRTMSGTGEREYRSDTSARLSLDDLANENGNSRDELNTLDVLRSVFKRMPGHSGSTDLWLQRRATVATPSAADKYHEQLSLFKERFASQPSAPKSLRWFFNRDAEVLEQVKEERRMGTTKENETNASIKGRLFERLSKRPGELRRFEFQVARDLERYTRELQHFEKVVLPQFDEMNKERLQRYGAIPSVNRAR